MKYAVHVPSPELQPFVKCFWTLEDDGAGEPARQRIIPDGCMEMIFHYGDPYKQYFEDGRSVIQPRSFIFGQITRHLEIEPTGRSGIVAARFLPEGLAPFIPAPVSSLENKAVAIADLFGKNAEALERDVMAAAHTPQRIKLIEGFLIAQLADPQMIDTVARACVETIFETQGQLDVVQLADKMNINRRNMERRFTSVIGMSPKQLSKLVRLQTAMKIMEQGKFSSLTSLAYETGYYDQAHFIKDFKEFTGVSPKSFFAKNLRLSGLFIAAE